MIKNLRRDYLKHYPRITKSQENLKQHLQPYRFSQYSLAVWSVLEKSFVENFKKKIKILENIRTGAFLENLHDKDIFSKFAKNAQAAVLSNNNFFRCVNCLPQTVNFSKGIYSKNDSTSKRLELRELSSRMSFSIVQKTGCFATNGVKPLYSGHLRFLKKVSSPYIEFWTFSR